MSWPKFCNGCSPYCLSILWPVFLTIPCPCTPALDTWASPSDAADHAGPSDVGAFAPFCMLPPAHSSSVKEKFKNQIPDTFFVEVFTVSRTRRSLVWSGSPKALFRGTSVTQSVKLLSSVQVMITGSWDGALLRLLALLLPLPLKFLISERAYDNCLSD